jgi:uncharacterized protein (TIGR02266 family)
MAQDTRKDPRAKVLTLTVRYKSATVDEFIEHHSHDVSRGGIFIKTPSPFAPGTLLKFEIKISEDRPVLQGVGRVVWKRETPQASADLPAGMGVKFIKLDEASRAVIDRLVGARPEGTHSAYESDPAGRDRAAGAAAGPGNPSLASARKGTIIGLGSPMKGDFTSLVPSNEPGFFPSQQSPAPQPPPEERTVMKQTAELLQEALKDTSGSVIAEAPMFEPPAGRGSGRPPGATPAYGAPASPGGNGPMMPPAGRPSGQPVPNTTPAFGAPAASFANTPTPIVTSPAAAAAVAAFASPAAMPAAPAVAAAPSVPPFAAPVPAPAPSGSPFGASGAHPAHGHVPFASAPPGPTPHYAAPPPAPPTPAPPPQAAGSPSPFALTAPAGPSPAYPPPGARQPPGGFGSAGLYGPPPGAGHDFDRGGGLPPYAQSSPPAHAQPGVDPYAATRAPFGDDPRRPRSLAPPPVNPAPPPASIGRIFLLAGLVAALGVGGWFALRNPLGAGSNAPAAASAEPAAAAAPSAAASATAEPTPTAPATAPTTSAGATGAAGAPAGGAPSAVAPTGATSAAAGTTPTAAATGAAGATGATGATGVTPTAAPAVKKPKPKPASTDADDGRPRYTPPPESSEEKKKPGEVLEDSPY